MLYCEMLVVALQMFSYQTHCPAEEVIASFSPQLLMNQ